MLYLSLLESMRQWFESRGETDPHASYAAAIGASVLAYMNVVSATLFARAIFHLDWLEAFANIPLNLVALAVLFAFHAWLLQRARSMAQRSGNRPGGASSRVAPPWLVYLVVSVVLLFCGTLLALR